jgi:hypothetical protein
VSLRVSLTWAGTGQWSTPDEWTAWGDDVQCPTVQPVLTGCAALQVLNCKAAVQLGPYKLSLPIGTFQAQAWSIQALGSFASELGQSCKNAN